MAVDSTAMPDGRVDTVKFQVRKGSIRLLQVNCRSIKNKEIEFWNLVEACDPDVIIGTESWLTEEIANSEIFVLITGHLGGIEILEVGGYSFV